MPPAIYVTAHREARPRLGHWADECGRYGKVCAELTFLSEIQRVGNSINGLAKSSFLLGSSFHHTGHSSRISRELKDHGRHTIRYIQHRFGGRLYLLSKPWLWELSHTNNTFGYFRNPNCQGAIIMKGHQRTEKAQNF